ncbi:FecR family protein [Pseudomonas viridiflava]|uniref:FecR protein super protein n=1 Tax=Pseudomonas viridiflava TaxID=33069 RepID=A0A3M5PHC5_PSEVI|nr:FecR family protein [Pseudomonas viridiflava]MBA1228498.1 FecR family protein [Pseudomonas viridiflava]RMT84001.1 FecR protein super protein [Pseudomonas viridiflava]
MNEPSLSEAQYDQITDAAAHWCMRLHADDCSPAEKKQFDHWLKAHPLHAVEFQAMQEVWDISGQVQPVNPSPVIIPTLSHTQPPPGRQRGVHWRPLAVAAAVATLAIPIAGYMGWNQGLIPTAYQTYTTTDATRLVTMDDGSRVEMDLSTELVYADYKDRRSVTLKKGEAFFEVSHDVNHPFVVDAGQGSIKVTGTRFNVWTYQDQVRVMLVEGSVQVSSDRSQPGHSAALAPGMQARYKAGDNHPGVSPIDPNDTALAWRNGKLIFNDLPLSQALPMINRYLQTPILLADSATGKIRLGGTYNTRDIPNLLASLPKVLPVKVTQNQNGNPVLNRRLPDSPKG